MGVCGKIRFRCRRPRTLVDTQRRHCPPSVVTAGHCTLGCLAPPPPALSAGGWDTGEGGAARNGRWAPETAPDLSSATYVASIYGWLSSMAATSCRKAGRARVSLAVAESGCNVGCNPPPRRPPQTATRVLRDGAHGRRWMSTVEGTVCAWCLVPRLAQSGSGIGRGWGGGGRAAAMRVGGVARRQ